MTRERAQEFARAHVDFAWRVARRLGLGRADAEDVAQKAMLIATSKLDAVNPGSEQAFVFGTVAHLVSKVFRLRRRRPEEPEEAADEPIDHEANPEHLLEQRRARATLDAILATLATDLRAAFVLFEIEGLSQPEIAEALGLPVGTVASRLRRAREEFTRAAVRRGVLPNDARRRQ
jgi:RNA polymerase sigma-70 factor (ECF subfamily)